MDKRTNRIWYSLALTPILGTLILYIVYSAIAFVPVHQPVFFIGLPIGIGITTFLFIPSTIAFKNNQFNKRFYFLLLFILGTILFPAIGGFYLDQFQTIFSFAIFVPVGLIFSITHYFVTTYKNYE